ncbi:hypothetical protein LO488_001142 [Staphylococcus pseudintermedius]|nr:hypothetical protein [Staphylococcus pseudintermedius]
MAPIHAISVTDIDIDFVVLAVHPICFLNQLIKINAVAGVYDSPHTHTPFILSQFTKLAGETNKKEEQRKKDLITTLMITKSLINFTHNP